MKKEVIQYNDLIISFLNKEITVEDIVILKQWMNESEENKKVFFEMKATWSLTSQTQKSNIRELDDALSQLNKKITSQQSDGEAGRRFIFVRIMRIAAAFLLTASISSLITYLTINNSSKDITSPKTAMVTVFAPMGSKAMTILPDGSQVWLNAGSKLSYAQNYNSKERIVQLEGEGFFDVKTNPEKPFVVKAKGLDIKAYGTAFNVKAYIEEKQVITTLVRGKVFIEGKDRQNKKFTILMSPKQSVACTVPVNNDNDRNLTQAKIDIAKSVAKAQPEDESGMNLPVITSEDVKTELFTSWKDNRWVINGEEIGDLAVSLERKFNVTIHFNSEEIKKYRFTGIFQNETLEQVLQVLKMTAPMSYEIGKGSVILSIDESLKKKFNKYFMKK